MRWWRWWEIRRALRRREEEPPESTADHSSPTPIISSRYDAKTAFRERYAPQSPPVESQPEPPVESTPESAHVPAPPPVLPAPAKRCRRHGIVGCSSARCQA